MATQIKSFLREKTYSKTIRAKARIESPATPWQAIIKLAGTDGYYAKLPRQALAGIIGNKWQTLIYLELFRKSIGFELTVADLDQAVGCERKTRDKALKALESKGLIERCRYRHKSAIKRPAETPQGKAVIIRERGLRRCRTANGKWFALAAGLIESQGRKATKQALAEATGASDWLARRTLKRQDFLTKSKARGGYWQTPKPKQLFAAEREAIRPVWQALYTVGDCGGNIIRRKRGETRKRLTAKGWPAERIVRGLTAAHRQSEALRDKAAPARAKGQKEHKAAFAGFKANGETSEPMKPIDLADYSLSSLEMMKENADAFADNVVREAAELAELAESTASFRKWP